MSGSFESVWTNTWDCVHVSGWSGLAAGLSNCLSSAAHILPSSVPCVLIQSCCPGLVSSPLVTCVSSSRGAAGIWSCSREGWCTGGSTHRAHGSGACWTCQSSGNQDTLIWASSPSSRGLSQVIHSDDHALYFFFLTFNGVVISLLCESLMLLWLNTVQSVAQWFGVVSKQVVCGNALASPNRNACLLSTDCITCKTTGGQNAHLTDFKTIVTIGGEEMFSQSEPGLVDKHPHFQAWGLLVVNSGCSCCQNKSGYCGNLYSYPWYPCLG